MTSLLPRFGIRGGGTLIDDVATPQYGASRFNRKNVFARDANRCQYCNRNQPTSELSLDHVIPKSKGGPTTWDNIVCACVACNVRKGGRTPREAGMVLTRKPRKPRYSPLLTVKLHNPKYASWKSFVDKAYWLADLQQ